ncbi:MAG: hypothetical protein KF680_10005 [Cryobacterium sp.]|nr:hypothetical protein [Cryobacterium sp.]
MGPNEKLLRQIIDAPQWEIPINRKLNAAMTILSNAMRSVRSKLDKGWTGTAAVNARELFTALEQQYDTVETVTRRLDGIINDANSAKREARRALDNLPSPRADLGFFNGVRDFFNFVADSDVGPWSNLASVPRDYINYWDQQAQQERESEARNALIELQRELRDPQTQLRTTIREFEAFDIKIPDPVPYPDPLPPFAPGPWGGSYLPPVSPPPRINGPGPTPPPVAPPLPPAPVPMPVPFPDGGWPPRDPSIDSGGSGTLTGLGLAGGAGGAGAAALAAGARLSGAGLGTGSAGGLGAGGLGAGGLGAGGLGGAGGGGLAGAAGAAGRGGGTPMGMMGGGGAGSDKEKRRGLGGPMAPKLEDDEELGPRSAAAGAGGRDPESGE